ncbi:MAG: hypothetical protein ABL996_19130, partial [Micropepsaceae bacterium]
IRESKQYWSTLWQIALSIAVLRGGARGSARAFWRCFPFLGASASCRLFLRLAFDVVVVMGRAHGFVLPF